ncbi:MAG: VWA domain-containing protein [Lachnospiraceae bacterium]|nr:VWA domain-containing protein [Lachnospiraceae bacterium]
MFCSNCGKENPDGAKFCRNCGAKMGMPAAPPEKAPREKKPMNKKAVVAVIVLVLILIGGGVYIATSPGRKLAAYQKAYDELDDRFYPYIVEDSDQASYDEDKNSFKNAIAKEDLDACKYASNQLDQLEKELKNSVKDKVQKMADEVTNAGTSNLCEVEIDDIAKYKSEGAKYLKKNDYLNAKKQYQECKRIIDAANSASKYGMDLRQIDVTNFPSVKLYLSITDLSTGESLDKLDASGFSLKERISAKVGYKDVKIQSVSQMDQKEGLNTAIVADVSASMGSNLGLAQTAMSNFVSSMQFNVNDKAALYSFADSVYREQFFTDNESTLKSAINGLNMGNMTALYDAIVYSISDIVVEDGAKCVIAFTDGMENNSVSSKSYVIEKAKQYDIPVYIIGIGNGVDTSDLTDIANQTGGAYWNISNVSSMDQVYNEIYQAQKAMYVVQYTTQKKSEAELEREVYIRFSNQKYLVRAEKTYTPANYKIDGFVFYDSDARYLSESELSKLSEEEVLIALNELYARRNYKFQTNAFLIDHFNKCSWYKGLETDQAKVESKFNNYETANKDLLVKYEKKHKLNNRK